MRFFYCGTPTDECNGKLAKTDHLGLKNTMIKVHSGSKEAHACYARSLVSKGFTRLSSREYLSPEGCIRVIDKVSHFGLPCRWGKEKSRIQPVKNNGPWVLAK
jgi:hypothetical protein